MANANTPDEWHFRIRRVATGTVTRILIDKTRIGRVIEIDGPYGMAFLREQEPRDVVCIAGGSGLAPMLSIATAFAQSEHLQSRKLHFFYGARSMRDVCGGAELALLPGYGDRITYHPAISDHCDDWRGRCGLIGDIAAADLGESLKDHMIYFAGPPAMADSILKTVIAAGVPLKQVRYDRFY